MELPNFRQRLAQRLEAFPLLRTLVLDGAFFGAFSVGLAIVAGLAIGVPRVWRTTPDDFHRATVKVSLIDLVQAWALSRSARHAEAIGDYDKAILSWRSALVNNLGDPALHRSVLTHLYDVPEARPDNLILAQFSSIWLLALTHTNAADLHLTTGVLEKYRIPGYALSLLAASQNDKDPAFDVVKARCLFTAGQVDEFLALWQSHQDSWQTDPELKLYHDAWRAGWESDSAAIESMIRLKEATKAPGNTGLTAARLLMIAATRRGVPDDVALALSRLQAGKADSVAQHAIYWRFLTSVGRFDEAQQKARAYRSIPRVPMDAAEYAASLAALGLRDEALAFLENNLARFETDPSVWEVYLSILIDARRWNDIRRAAAEVQIKSASFETVRIISVFAQYRAEVAEGREYTANGLAHQLAEARILDNPTALRIGSSLLRDGRADDALQLLQKKRAELKDRSIYWQLVFGTALHVKDLPSLKESTTELLRLSPNDPVALSNRAAMLIAIEDQPTEALEITFRLLNDYPNSAPFQINHAFALLLNHRVDEAWRLLTGLDPSRLERQAASAFHLAMTEALYARGQFSQALEESDKVQNGMILPPQVDRLERLKRDLRKKLGS